MMKRVLAILLALTLALTSAAVLAETAEVTAETEATTETTETTEETAEETEEAAQTEETAETEETEQTEEAEEEPAEPALLVTVNGEEIKEDHSDLTYYVSYFLYMLSSSGYDISDESLRLEVNQHSLLNTIELVLLRQKAAELGLSELSEEFMANAEAEAKASWEEILESYATNYFGITAESSEEDKTAARADTLALLEAQGYSEEGYLEEMIDGSVTNELISRVRAYVTQDIAVTDEDVLAYFSELVLEDQETYEGNIANYEFATRYYGEQPFYQPSGYRGVTHILLDVDEELMDTWKDLAARLEEQQEAETAESTETAEEAETAETEETAETPEPTAEPVTPEMVEAARQAILDSVQDTVNEIMDKYQAGTSFEDLIKEYGTDPGMEDEKTLAEGYAIHPESILYDTDFVNGAMALENVGDISDPVLSQFGVHIMQYLRDVPSGPIELSSTLQEELRDALLTEKESDAFEQCLSQWMAESDIVYTEVGEAWKLPEEEAAE